ncbi:MAG: alginate export family protein [Bacteroidota bacterium]
MKIIGAISLTIILSIALIPAAHAQFNVDGQIVQRAEYRHGFGKLIEENEEAAAFIAQRARLNVQYELESFKFYVSIQDVRTWGNTPQVKPTDPYLSLHEAWAETFLSDNFSIKLGRQELNYDNFRFLGNLDWALQGRAHDFALLKYEKGALKFHAGGGYNQDNQSLNGNFFSTPNQYKVAHFLRYENIAGKFNFSLLFWNNGLQYSEVDNAGEIIKTGIHYRQTFGLPSLKYQLGNTGFAGFYYHQVGKDLQGRDVKAYDASAQISQNFPIDTTQGSNFRLTLGIELLTGTDPVDNATENNSFSPLYGTNHAHNGYMDMFYVGGRHENSVGLRDLFLRMRYDMNPKLFLSLNIHSFNSFTPYSENEDEHLGYETDLALGYILNRSVSLQAGYSHFFQSDQLENLQNVQNPAGRQNWGYLMMIYRPTMKNRFIGLLF